MILGAIAFMIYIIGMMAVIGFGFLEFHVNKLGVWSRILVFTIMILWPIYILLLTFYIAITGRSQLF